MIAFRTLVIAATAASFSLVSYAQSASKHDAHHPQTVPAADMAKPSPMQDSAAPMARMDAQMKAMQAMHDKMMLAKTPEQRSAMMAEHMKIMQESMDMTAGMGAGNMQGKPGMGAKMDGGMGGKMCEDMGGAMGMQHQMMEKRMQMMQSMMQMMMDCMPAAAPKSPAKS